MNTVKDMEKLIDIAQQLGYRIRYDYFGGTGGGICQFGGSRWVFIDLALTSAEQLVQLQNSLADEPLYQMMESKQSAKKVA